MGRFGGGGQYELGIDVGRWNSFIIKLIWGSIRVSQPRKCPCCAQPILSGQRSGPWLEGGYNKHLACFEAEATEKKVAEALARDLDPKPIHPSKPVPFADDDIPF